MILAITNLALVENELALIFSDGKETYLPFELLRRACPCALCQGEPDALGRVSKPKVAHVANSYQLNKIEKVGGYALQLYWEDGHSTGLYSYIYLRSLGQLP